MAKRTPLYDWHTAQGAKFTDFSGWEMPVQYSSIVQEHQAVRTGTGVFDISHMGQVFVEGPWALGLLQKLCTNDIARCAPGKAMYSHFCNEHGGIVDDVFVYCFNPQRYLVVVNAATTDKDFAWMKEHLSGRVTLEDASERLSMIAVQGPKSPSAVEPVLGALPKRLEFLEKEWEGAPVYLCRTGYTGEDGFEIIAPHKAAVAVLERVMESGKAAGIRPCGLGARDTLRLEAGYLLYGSDADDDTTPLEAGLPWVVKFGKGDFLGREALDRQKSLGVARTLTGFRLEERGVPRHGSRILCDGKEAGTVTSGTFSPTLQAGIAIGYLPAGADGEFAIECSGRAVPAERVKLPFYTKQKGA